jgi:hypothetical protein
MFYLYHRIQTDCGVPLTSYETGNGAFYSELKWPKHELEQLMRVITPLTPPKRMKIRCLMLLSSVFLLIYKIINNLAVIINPVTGVFYIIKPMYWQNDTTNPQ